MGRLFIRAFVSLALLFVTTVSPRQAHAGAGNWIKVSVPYTSLAAAATGATLTLYTTKGLVTVERVIMRRDVDFAGGVISAYTVSVGKSGAVTKYLGATDVFTGVSNGDANSIVGTVAGVEPVGTAIIATAASTGANTNAATAGRLTFYILISPLPVGN